MTEKRKDWRDQTNEELVSGFQNILVSVQDVHPRYLLLRSFYLGIELGKRQQKAKDEGKKGIFTLPFLDKHNHNNLGSIISHGHNE